MRRRDESGIVAFCVALLISGLVALITAEGWHARDYERLAGRPAVRPEPQPKSETFAWAEPKEVILPRPIPTLPPPPPPAPPPPKIEPPPIAEPQDPKASPPPPVLPPPIPEAPKPVIAEKKDPEPPALAEVRQPEASPPPVENLQEPAGKPPPPNLAVRHKSEFGEAEGKGESINSSPGEKLAEARWGPQDQAWLSKDPEGKGKLPDVPAKAIEQLGQGRSAGRLGRPGPRGDPAKTEAKGDQPEGPFALPVEAAQARPRMVRLQPPAPIEKGVEQAPSELVEAREEVVPERVELIAIRLDGEGPQAHPGETEQLEAVVKREAVPRVDPRPRADGGADVLEEGVLEGPPQEKVEAVEAKQAMRPSITGEGGAPGIGDGPASGDPNAGTAQAADPAPMSDSESDPFSKKGKLVFKPGRIDAQMGRKFKAHKPRLTFKGELDLYSMVNRSVVLRINIDETGKVTDVAVLRSSGSNEVDLPTMLAAYHWWIEPPKDPQGKPTSDVMVLTLSWL